MFYCLPSISLPLLSLRIIGQQCMISALTVQIDLNSEYPVGRTWIMK